MTDIEFHGAQAKEKHFEVDNLILNTKKDAFKF